MKPFSASSASLRETTAAGVLLACLACLLWSGNYVVARGMRGVVPPVALAFFRWTTGTLVLLPFALPHLKGSVRLLRPHLGYLLLTAALGVTLFNTLIYVAGLYSPAINLAVIGTTAAPVFVLLIVGLLLKEPVRRWQLIGALLSILGILILLSKGRPAALSELRLTPGDGWITGAALAFALYTVLVRRKPAALHPVLFLFALFLLGTLLLLPAFLVERTYTGSFRFTGGVAGVFLYLGAGASAAAFAAWNGAVRRIGPARTALFALLIPLFSTMEAILFLGEPGGAYLWAALLVIAAGVGFAQRR